MKKYKKLITWVALIICAYLLFSFLISSGILNRYYSRILVSCCISVILAVSLNLITGFTGQLSLGHSGFMAIGAYTSAYLSTTTNIPFIISIIIGALFATIIGFLVGLPTLKLKGDYFAIATLGICEIIRVLITNIDALGGARGLSGIPRETNFTLVYFAMVLTIVIIANIIHSSKGRSMIAIRENEIAAEAMGVNTTKYKIMAFLVSVFFAGIAGGLFAHHNGFIQPTAFNFLKSIEILTFVVLGGMGSLSGSIIAAIVLTILPEALRSFADLRMIFYSLALIIVMIFRPKGLFGNMEITDVLKKFKKKSKTKEV